MHSDIQKQEETLTFNDFIIISRASPAKSLGLAKIKGNLGKGADGDLNILDLNVNDINISENFEVFKKSLLNIEYVIKYGDIIKHNDKISLENDGKILWAEGNVEKEDKSLLLNRKKEFYEKYYSIFYDSLKISVEDKYLRHIN